MNGDVAAFSSVMQRQAALLGPVDCIEWMRSDAPIDYPDALHIMDRRASDIASGAAPELIWFLEHPPLYTGGTSAKPADLLDANRFPVFSSGRGGQFTYHGPGQLIAYVMLDLNKRGRDVRSFVHKLETLVIAALGDYGVHGVRREGYPGVWVEGENNAVNKIAAIGVRVRRWITLHGVSINICPDLEHYTGILPCGIADGGVTSLRSLGKLRETSTPLDPTVQSPTVLLPPSKSPSSWR